MWSSALGFTMIMIFSVVKGFSGASDGLSSSSHAPSELSLLEQIPDGYVLVPIEPINLDALDSIFENYGYVDLYRSDESGDAFRKVKRNRIATSVVLVRAPKNPRRFAVVLHESAEDTMASLNEPVFAVLRKTKKTRSGPTTESSLKKKIATDPVSKRRNNYQKTILIEETGIEEDRSEQDDSKANRTEIENESRGLEI
jgi:hypothetical protein